MPHGSTSRAIVSTEGIAKANLSSACHGKLQAQSQIGAPMALAIGAGFLDRAARPILGAQRLSREPVGG
jgi:hypothetical protein